MYVVDDGTSEALSVALVMPNGEQVMILSNAGDFGPQVVDPFDEVVFETIEVPEAAGQELNGEWTLRVRSTPTSGDPVLRTWGLQFRLRSG